MSSSALKGDTLAIVGSGVTGCAVAHFAQNFYKNVILIDDFENQKSNAFMTNAGSLHDGYGTTGHPQSAMISRKNPLLDTIRITRKHPHISSLLFMPTLGKSFRALSALVGLYNDDVRRDSAAIFYYLQKRSSELLAQIAKEESVPHDKGRIVLCNSESYLSKSLSALELAKKDFTITSEVLDATQVKAKLPSSSDKIVGGIYYPTDLSFHAPTFRQKWLDKLRKSVQFVQGTVDKVELNSRNVTKLIIKNNDTEETIDAQHFVFCTGAKNHPIMNPYTLPGGGISVDLDLKKNSHNQLGNLHTYTPEKLLYTYPYNDGKSLRLCSGLFMGKATLGESKKHKAQEAMIEAFYEYFKKEVEFEKINKTFIAARPLSTDAMPIIGKLPYLDNASIVNGMGSYGYPSVALVEAVLFPSEQTPTPPPNFYATVSPRRFSSTWLSVARLLS